MTWPWMLSFLWLLPACSALGQSAIQEVKVDTVTHRKLDGCVQVTVGGTRLIVVPSWAGRISVLDFGQGNVMWQHPSYDGKLLAPAEAWMLWDGNATDIVNTDGKMNQLKQLWLHPYPKVTPLKNGVELSSNPNTDAQLSATKRYELSADGKTLTYSVTLVPQGQGQGQQGWTVWERACVPGATYAVAPLDKGGPVPDGVMIRDKAKVEPADRMAIRDGFLVVRGQTKQGVGLAAKLRSGWIASVQGRNVLLFVYSLDPKGKYPHFNGANSVFWMAPEKIEIEPMSPDISLSAGKLPYTFTQTWMWLTLPANVSADDPVAVGKWAATQAPAGR